MKKLSIRSLILILIPLFMVGCASKKYFKDGNKYEENGMYEPAIVAYLNALTKKPDYVEARIALMRSSAIFATQLDEKITEAYTRRNDEVVVSLYQTLTTLKEKTAPYNIETIISERTIGQYNESKNRYLHDSYEEAMKAMGMGDYNKAVKLLQGLTSVDNNFKDATEQLKIARCEPIYIQANIAFHNGKYRTAYNFLSQIKKYDSNYKDIDQLQQDAISQGMRLIAFETINNCNSYALLCNKIKTQTLTTVNKSNDPFIQMVELAEQKQLEELQKELMQSGNQVASQNLIPVNAVIKASIGMNNKTTPLTSKKCKGYLRQTDKEKNVVYKKVYYYEYSRTRNISINFSYTIMSTPSGAKLSSGTLTPHVSDEIHYVYYDGKNDKYLVPGHWEKIGKFNAQEDVIYSDANSISKIRNLADSRKELKSIDDMQSELVKSITTSLSKAILSTSPKE